MNVEKLTAILKGRIRTNAVVFRMITDCYRKGKTPAMQAVTELTEFSSVVSFVHEAICLQVLFSPLLRFRMFLLPMLRLVWIAFVRDFVFNAMVLPCPCWFTCLQPFVFCFDSGSNQGML